MCYGRHRRYRGEAFQPLDGRPEVRRAEVRVALGHLQVAVPEDLLHVLQARAPHDQMAGGRVAQIVEPEALRQSGLGHAFGPTRIP